MQTIERTLIEGGFPAAFIDAFKADRAAELLAPSV